MEFAKPEMSAVSEVAIKFEEAILELADSELLFVGGGTGDVQLG